MTNTLNDNDLENVAGGIGCPSEDMHMAMPMIEPYLALRTSPNWDDGNEIAQISSGTRFYVNVKRVADCFYWANYNGTCGWVYSNHLTLLD